jgi:outer membrane protein TolC
MKSGSRARVLFAKLLVLGGALQLASIACWGGAAGMPILPPSNAVVIIDLPTTLRLVRAQNLDVQLAQARLQEALAQRTSAEEQFFPWVSPGVSFRRHDNHIQDVGGSIYDVHKQSYSPGGLFSAQLELGDATYKTLAAKQVAGAFGHAVTAQTQDASLAAAQRYYDLARSQALMTVLQEAVDLSREYQDQVQHAVEAGIAFKGDELRVQVQTERYAIELRQAVEQRQEASARLVEVLHLDGLISLQPRETDLVPLTLVDTNLSLNDLVQQALQSRPELKQTQQLLSAAREAKKGAVYGPWIPAIGGQAFIGGLGGGVGSSTGNFGETEEYYAGLGWRIGPGGLFDLGRIRSSRAQVEIARLASEKLRTQVIREVVETQARTRSLEDQISARQRNLITATDTLRLTRQRKEFGVGIVLEDIQAQQELTRARSDYVSTVADYCKTQFALKHSLGDSPNPAQAKGP